MINSYFFFFIRQGKRLLNTKQNLLVIGYLGMYKIDQKYE